MSRTKIVVVLAIAGAVVFGLAIGYLALTNDSFSSVVKPFGGYANVTSDTFNGTEFAFNIRWDNTSALPLYAQLSSPTTDAANTPVCGVGISSVAKGQTIFMAFTISPASATLANVDLTIEVKSLASGNEFSIVYNVPTISATNALIHPSDISCQQPQGSL